MKILKSLSVLLIISLVLTSCNDYGKKLVSGSLEVYYKDGVTEEQAQKAANFIAGSRGDNAQKASMQLCKINGVFCFRMVYDKEIAKTVADEVFYELGNNISDNIFNGAPVNVELTGDAFETFKTFPYKKTTPLQELPQRDVPSMQQDSSHQNEQ